MNSSGEKTEIEQVPDADAYGKRNAPGAVGIRRRIGKRHHHDREQRRVMVVPSVVIGDLVWILRGANRPRGSQINIKVCPPVSQKRGAELNNWSKRDDS
jgi:hypothetical protein